MPCHSGQEEETPARSGMRQRVTYRAGESNFPRERPVSIPIRIGFSKFSDFAQAKMEEEEEEEDG